MKVKFSQFFPFIYRHFPITFIFFFFLVVYFWLCWVFVAAWIFFLSCSKQGLLSACSALVCHCRGFSCYGAWALGIVGFSSCSFWALEHRLNSCGAQAYLLHGMWNPSRSGIKPVSPALAGGLFTTEPSGKPPMTFQSHVLLSLT